MRRTTLILIALAVLSAQFFASCCRRPLEEEHNRETALIPVKIDWSQSNIPVSEDDPSGGEFVHRVAFRFYPEDGSPIFERYLEGNIFEGEIDVPVGRYKVIVMNESVDDHAYWEDVITFSDADSYDNFSATVNPMPEDYRLLRFPFYQPVADERLIVAPYYLASWSLDSFEVTQDMVDTYTYYTTYTPTRATVDAFSNIVMRGLVYNVNVSAYIYNLVSVHALHTAAQGFADKVYMASGRTVQSPTTHLFLLNKRVWEKNNRDGLVHNTFLSFGRLPQEARYRVAMDILFVDGELYTVDGPMTYDVTDQVTLSTGMNIDIRLPEEIRLPYVEGGIFVDDWDDGDIDLM